MEASVSQASQWLIELIGESKTLKLFKRLINNKDAIAVDIAREEIAEYLSKA